MCTEYRSVLYDEMRLAQEARDGSQATVSREHIEFAVDQLMRVASCAYVEDGDRRADGSPHHADKRVTGVCETTQPGERLLLVLHGRLLERQPLLPPCCIRVDCANKLAPPIRSFPDTADRLTASVTASPP